MPSIGLLTKNLNSDRSVSREPIQHSTALHLKHQMLNGMLATVLCSYHA